MVGSGVMQNVHFIAPGGAKLELILDGDLVWFDLHDSTVNLHYVAEQVFEEIYDSRRLLAHHRLRLLGAGQHGDAGAGQPRRRQKRPISPAVAQFTVLPESIAADGGVVTDSTDAGGDARALRRLSGARPQPVAAGRNLAGDARSGRPAVIARARRDPRARSGDARAVGVRRYACPGRRAPTPDAAGDRRANARRRRRQRGARRRGRRAGRCAVPAFPAVVVALVPLARAGAREGDAQSDRRRHDRHRRGRRRRDRRRRGVSR